MIPTQNEPKILHNRLKCLKCADVIESTHRWAFVRCKCGAVFVDGGREYVRYGGDLANIQLLTEYEQP